MAKFDVRRFTAQHNASTDTPTLTFTSPASVGDIILLAYGAYDATITAPVGFSPTPLISFDDGTPGARLRWYAKLATGSEPSAYPVTVDPARNTGGVGYIVEGPFTDLSGVSVVPINYTGGSPTINVPTSATNIPAAGLSIAYMMLGYAATEPISSISWSNGYTTRSVGGGSGNHIYTASRSFSVSGPAQTTMTASNDVFANHGMIFVTDSTTPPPSGGNTPRSMFYHLQGMR